MGSFQHVKPVSILLACLLAVLVVSVCFVQPGHAAQVYTDTTVPKPFNHHVWQEVLYQFVNQSGEVDFRKLRIMPQRLNDYMTQLSRVSPERTPDYFPTIQDQLAYWVNAHNALALRLILDEYPVNSLKDVSGLVQNNRYPFGGVLYALQVIRKKIDRLDKSKSCVFMLTNYTKSSPPLSKTACEGHCVLKLAKVAKTRVLHSSVLVQRDGVSDRCSRVTVSPFFKGYSDQFGREVSDGSSVQSEALVKGMVKPYKARVKACGSVVQYGAQNDMLRQASTIW